LRAPIIVFGPRHCPARPTLVGQGNNLGLAQRKSIRQVAKHHVAGQGRTRLKAEILATFDVSGTIQDGAHRNQGRVTLTVVITETTVAPR